MKITTGNWLYNAGIVGFLRILKEKGIPYSDVIKDGVIILTPDLLNGFADAYFNYALRVQLDSFLIFKDENKIREVFKEDLQADFDNIKKKYLNRLTATAIIDKHYQKYSNEVIHTSDNYFNELIKIIEKSALSEKNNKIETLKKKIINAKHTKSASITSHGIFLNYFGNFYFNKLILCNPKKAMDRKSKFDDQYVAAAIKTISNDNNDGPLCRFCYTKKVEAKGVHNKELPVFNEGLFSIAGVSIDKFRNFFYNGIPDLFICNVCELIMLCSFAGLNKKPYQLAQSEGTSYLFLNMPSLESLLHGNDSLAAFYENYSEDVKDTAYEYVFNDILLSAQTRKSRWTLQNIFFVELKPSARKDRDKPVFKYANIGKDIAELFSDQFVVDRFKTVNGLLVLQKKTKGPRLDFQKDVVVNIKSEVINRLIENNSIFPLAYINLKNNLDYGIGISYNSLIFCFVQSVKKQINIAYSKGGISVDSKKVYGILAHQFYDRGKEDFRDQKRWPMEKKQRLAYKLLSLIRQGKYAEFYESLMKLYINLGKPIPESFLGLLNTSDTIDFEAKAYAFMSGFMQDTSTTIPNITTNQEGHNE
jgi:CRISPR-associated protein Cst1